MKKMYKVHKCIAILICGKAGVGKTTLAKYINGVLSCSYAMPTAVVAFADEIKRIAISEFHWDGVKDEKGRRLLQALGTEAGRMYNNDIWVQKTVNRFLNAYDKLIPDPILIIDDCRFPNEISVIKSNPMFDVISIRVEAPSREILKGTPEAKHASEISLPSGPNKLYTFTIENEGTLDELCDNTDELFLLLENKYLFT